MRKTAINSSTSIGDYMLCELCRFSSLFLILCESSVFHHCHLSDNFHLYDLYIESSLVNTEKLKVL